MTTVSVTQLIEPAIQFTKNLLFTSPVSFRKWLKLAFVAWLAGEAFVGGGGGGFNIPTGGPPDQPYSPSLTPLWEYLREHIVVIIILVGIMLGLIITLSVIFAILRAIFTFIFIDALAKNQVAIGPGFARFQSLGWRLFFFRLIVGLIIFFLVILAIALPVIILIASVGGLDALKDSGFIPIVITVLGIIILLLPIILIGVLVHTFTNNFVVPTMYVQNIGILPAWKRYWKTLQSHAWDTVRFLLMKFVLGIGGGIITFLVVLAVLIPFGIIGFIIGGITYLLLTAMHLALAKVTIMVIAISVPIGILIIPLFLIMICLLLPLAVFFRTYTLLFLGACDHELAVLKSEGNSLGYPSFSGAVPAT
ncbi:MAG: hypothetical protein N3A72_03800 [bacterium]|nr:hypothetical protein [bacterium]